MTKLLSSSLCAALILACPGLPAYAAVSARVNAPAPVNAGAPVALPRAAAVMPALSATSLSAPSLGASAAVLSAPQAVPVAAPLAALPLAAAPEAPAAAPSAMTAAPAAASLRETMAAVDAAKPAPGTPAAALSAAPILGRFFDGWRGRMAPYTAPADAPRAAFSPAVSHLAKPAGDSIREAAEAAADGPSVPTPPTGANESEEGTPAPRGNGPLLPRLLASAIALAPAYFFGLPLIAAQGFLVGGLLIVSSVGMALMPLMGPGTGKTLRAIPGLALAATGLVGVGVAVSLSYGLGVPTAMSLLAPGLFALVGGWGLTRYGVSGPRHRFDRLESVTAFFGGIAALTGMGLAAVGVTGWLTAGLLWLSYPLSMMLWAHLPSWMGKAVETGFRGIFLGAKGSWRVVGAIRRDTVIFDRLMSFSRRMYQAWKGNAVWLGLLIWGPLLIVEAVMYTLASVSGLLAGLAQLPAMAVWGSVDKLWPGSKAAVFGGEWARAAFDNVSDGKKRWFNKAEALLLPLANSPSFIKSALGGAGIRALQVVWLVAAPFASLALTLGGFFLALTRLERAYDVKRHDPDHLRVSTDDSAGEKPQEPGEDTDPAPAKTPFAAKVFTALLALAPAVYFGLPLLTEGFSIIRAGLFLSAALPLAAAPFMGKGTPFFLRGLVGTALTTNGLVLLVSGHAVIAGLIAFLGGWGYRTYLRELENGKHERFDEFDVAAFFGSFGAIVAVGAAWVGLSGWPLWAALGFGALTSPLLLQHLPRWVGAGVRKVFKAFSKSMEGFNEVLSFWYRHAFTRNLKAHASYWLEKHWTHGIWLSVIWVPTWLALAAEGLLAVALGLVYGAVRAPFAFLQGAFASAKPDSAATRFFNGLMTGWYETAEGSKAFFDKATAGLQEAMAAKSPVSSRPTSGAALALLGARFAQLLWLLGVAAMLPLGLLYGVYNGLKNAGRTPPSDPPAAAPPASASNAFIAAPLGAAAAVTGVSLSLGLLGGLAGLLVGYVLGVFIGANLTGNYEGRGTLALAVIMAVSFAALGAWLGS